MSDTASSLYSRVGTYPRYDHTTQPLEFFITEADGRDESIDGSDNFKSLHYTIRLFGVDDEGRSVCLTVPDYNPFFYVETNHTLVSKENLLTTIGGRLVQPTGPLKKGHLACIYSDSIRLVSAHELYGYRGGKKTDFLRVEVSTRFALRKLVSALNDIGVHTHEGEVDPVLQFLHAQRIDSYWVRISPNNYAPSTRSYVTRGQVQSTAQFDTCVTSWTMVEAIDKDTIPPIRQCTFDIETYSHDDSFPDPVYAHNVVFQIASTFKSFGSQQGSEHFDLKTICLLGEVDVAAVKGDDPKVVVHVFETEGELLLGWSNLIKIMDPDILIGYNSDGFDSSYLDVRVQMLHVAQAYYKNLSRLELPNGKWNLASLRKANFTTRAAGANAFERLEMPGRINFDLLFYLRKEKPLESYKLDNVAELLLGDKKHPVSPMEIFEAYRSCDPAENARVARYCIQDTLLPQRIIDQQMILPALVEMARVTHTPIRQLIERGQQIKVLSQILRAAHDKGYLIPDKHSIPKGLLSSTTLRGRTLSKEKWLADHPGEQLAPEAERMAESQYEHELGEDGGQNAEQHLTGGSVLKPIPGRYWHGIAVFDFASLYPSIIRAWNFCFTTIVLEERYGALEGTQYEDITWHEDGTEGKPVSFCSYRFAQDNDAALLPNILGSLFEKRKAVKRQMATETDPIRLAILDKRQSSIKISMNSIYGFLAAHLLPLRAISASVTATGRSMIHAVKDYVETKYLGATVVYGDTDSVFVNFRRMDLSWEDQFPFCSKVADAITAALFRPPIKLEFEKIMKPLLLLCKKRYLGNLYEEPTKMKQYSRGIVLKRRDNPPYVRDLYSAMTNLLLTKERDLEDSLFKLLKDTLEEILNHQMGCNKLVITKALAKGLGYADSTHLPHLEVARNLRKVGVRVNANDRISYLIREGVSEKERKGPVYQRAEPAESFENGKYKYDASFYIQQSQQPVLQLFELIGEEERAGKIYQESYKLAKSIPCQGQTTLDAFFGAQMPRKRQLHVPGIGSRLLKRKKIEKPAQ